MNPINKVTAIVAKKPFFDGHFQLYIICVQIDGMDIFTVFLDQPLRAKIISSYSALVIIISYGILSFLQNFIWEL
jgi:uncharacterized MnhB-related membrane protein